MQHSITSSAGLWAVNGHLPRFYARATNLTSFLHPFFRGSPPFSLTSSHDPGRRFPFVHRTIPNRPSIKRWSAVRRICPPLCVPIGATYVGDALSSWSVQAPPAFYEPLKEYSGLSASGSSSSSFSFPPLPPPPRCSGGALKQF